MVYAGYLRKDFFFSYIVSWSFLKFKLQFNINDIETIDHNVNTTHWNLQTMLIRDIYYIYIQLICIKSPYIDYQQDIMIYIAHFLVDSMIHIGMQTYSLTEKKTKTESKHH